MSLFQTAAVLCLVFMVMGNNNPGTTLHLKEIFIGRCWDYKEIKHKEFPLRTDVNCNDLWNDFYKAFSYQAPCDVAMEHYKEYIDLASQNVPENKGMFWSGTYDIAHEYAEAGKRFVTLEDTMIGFLANSLIWCGSGSTGANFTRCPSWTDCPLESSESFWASASREFASSVNGDVYLMLDGSRKDKPAYSKDSFFSKYELPALENVNKIVIIVKHNLDGPIKETCSNGSIIDLQEDILNRGFVFNCLDDPAAIIHLLCADDPEARECKMVNRNESYNTLLPVINSKPSRFNY
ncbi:hypothetical protein LOTGIDRAFT_218611 [Lottia gigantea]|uniref:Uncharacterized protein n=1 Tax=Lottia gigantea TaxID=225164 RepID=V3ZZD5_LOTGI|nr:hypothetical protein LOTGIDRAFT_218611 [Lottia gigantea]ESO89787.1 hypothetical protein LOTGIDRAFT_218611 [Lottia gigantea]